MSKERLTEHGQHVGDNVKIFYDDLTGDVRKKQGKLLGVSGKELRLKDKHTGIIIIPWRLHVRTEVL